MIPKQDMAAVRTAADVDFKYGQKYSDVLGIADDARTIASTAKKEVSELDKALGPEGVFNRLTNNGAAKGMYRDDDGNIYFNADYIKSGKLIAQEVNAVNENGVGVKIKDGTIFSGTPSMPYFALYPLYGGNGAWALTFNNDVPDGEQSIYVSGSITWNAISLGQAGQDQAPFQIEAYGHYRQPQVLMQLPVLNPHDYNNIANLYVYWKENSDGSYSLVGYKEPLQGG